MLNNVFINNNFVSHSISLSIYTDRMTHKVVSYVYYLDILNEGHQMLAVISQWQELVFYVFFFTSLLF